MVRRAVAEADPFDQRDRSFYVRASDRRDIVALLFAADKVDTTIAGPTFVAHCLGFDADRNPRDWRIRVLGELAEINDHGGYADPASLRRALLGEE